jgi:hypothetical protein
VLVYDVEEILDVTVGEMNFMIFLEDVFIFIVLIMYVLWRWISFALEQLEI